MSEIALGLKTDLMFFDFSKNKIEKEDYFVLKTPHNPEFFWGNYLLFKKPPCQGDFEKWTESFQKEFAQIKDINHMTFSWEEIGNEVEIDKFKDADFDFNETIVLMANKDNIHCKYLNPEIVCRRIVTDEDWDNILEFQLNTNERIPEKKFKTYIIKKMKDFRTFSESGLGFWYAAYINNNIISDLGLYWNSEIARYRDIKTQKEYRKKGISQTLIAFAAHDSKQNKFVIQTEEGGMAINMYKSIGFAFKEKIFGLCRYEKSVWDN
ncbi:GNAT family N-acetyltransferase [Fluviispira sanaruensis]|uniref:N-acetyltransferase domain-containing protein n=1 Tax=Fluviispira sanaruensis TaxID=2493639 RepID=A0A4P2VJ03_FLUSA|nr:GNAT family N-acetyltransferase [Fluviispira sanaruensis]BBH51874.1 hypothetical protein JCM31447_02990 [Fluviispira sanaruensis]